VPFEGLLKVDGLKRVPLGVLLPPRISELLSELAWLRERAKGASDDTRALINQYQTILRDSAAGHVHPQLTEVRKLSKRARFHLEPVDLAKNLRLEVSCGSREGPTVCRLSAGGSRIRTRGPALRRAPLTRRATRSPSRLAGESGTTRGGNQKLESASFGD
jgi:hypothetical protein